MNKRQFLAWAKLNPTEIKPAISQVPHIPDEVFVGDIIKAAVGTSVVGVPVPSNTVTYMTNGVAAASAVNVSFGSVLAPSYTVQSGDVGKSLKATQLLFNEKGNVTSDSNAVTVANVPTFNSMLLPMANIQNANEYSRNLLFGNMFFSSRGAGYIGSNGVGSQGQLNTTTYSLTFSAQTGSGVTMTVNFLNGTSTSSAYVLSGTASDIGKTFNLSDGGVAVVTAAGTNGSATVNITTALTTTTYTTWTAPFKQDAGGWPLQDFDVIFTTTASNASNFIPLTTDGQAPPGTYFISYQSPGQSTIVTAGGSAFSGTTPFTAGSVSTVSNAGTPAYTISNMVASGDGTTITAQIDVIQSGMTVVLRFVSTTPTNQQGAYNIIIPVDGTNNFNVPKFNPVALAYYSQYCGARFMTFANVIGSNETTWASRAPNYQNIVAQGTLDTTGSLSKHYSWETTLDFIQACYAYAGSTFVKAWINIPVGATLDYITGLATLLSSRITGGLLSNMIRWILEWGNEPWNSGQAMYSKLFSWAFSELNNGTTGTAIVCSNILPAPYNSLVNITRAGNGTTGTATAILQSIPATLTIGQQYDVAVIVGAATSAAWDKGTYLGTGGYGGTNWSTIKATVVDSHTVTWTDTYDSTGAGTDTSVGVRVQGYITPNQPILGYITGNQLVVTSVPAASYLLANNLTISGQVGISAGTTIVSQNTLTGGDVTGGQGTYTLNQTVTQAVGSSGTPVSISLSGQLLVVTNFQHVGTSTGQASSVNILNGSTVRMADGTTLVTANTAILGSFSTGVVWGNGNGGTTAGYYFLNSSNTQAAGVVGTAGSPVNLVIMNSGYQVKIMFNPNNLPLMGDGQANLFNFEHKYYVRQVRTFQNTWNAVRPIVYHTDGSPKSEFFTLNIQCASNNTVTTGGIAQGGMLFGTPPHFAWAAFVDPSGWMKAACVAPYVTGTSAGFVGDPTADMNTLFAQMTTAVNNSCASWLRGFIWACRKYGVRPMVYEAEQDFQQLSYTYNGRAYGYNVMAVSDARIGTIMTNLMDVWFCSGGKEFCAFGSSPTYWGISQQGVWSMLQDFSDTAIQSPRLGAIVSYRTRARQYKSTYSPSATDYGPGTINFATEYFNSLGGAINNATSPPLAYVNYSATADQYFDTQFTVERSNRYLFQVYGTDSAIGSVINLYVDNVLIGTATLVQGLAGNTSSSTNTGATEAAAYTNSVGATAAIIVSLASGQHNFRWSLPTTSSGAAHPGISTVKVSII